MYLIIRCNDCKFLSSFNMANKSVKFCSNLEDADLFLTQSYAQVIAFYCNSKVLIVKVFDVL